MQNVASTLAAAAYPRSSTQSMIDSQGLDFVCDSLASVHLS